MDFDWELDSPEESEQKNETEGKISEETEEDFQSEGVGTKEVMEEDESEEDDVPLRVLRPRRLSRSLSQENSLQTQSANNQEKMENLSESDRSMSRMSFDDEAIPPRWSRLGSERRLLSTAEKLKIMVSKQSHTPTSVKRKRNNKRRFVEKVPAEPFPEWVVNLMFNIEEATTHQLVVE